MYTFTSQWFHENQDFVTWVPQVPKSLTTAADT